MTSTLCNAQHKPGVPEQTATRLAFFIAGIGMATWAPLVPFAKTRIGLDDGALGLLLLCIGVGSIMAMPLTGVLTGKFGCRRVIILAGIVLCLVLPLLVLMESPLGMALALLLFGAAIGMVDVAMNIQAVVVERASGRAMMSGFHGFFSVGGIAGAGGVSALLWLGLGPLQATLIAVMVILILLFIASKHLLRESGGNKEGPLFVLPRGWVMFIGLLCFIMFLAEGSMLDWSALFLTTLRGMDHSQAGLGYALFSIAMTLGRLNGDRMVNAMGRYRMLLLGSLCAAIGLTLAIAVNSVIASLIGFMLVGVGASNVVPILFTAAGNQQTMPANLAIASVTTVGYAGILAGPALIGFIAQFSSLTFALACVASMLLIVTASAKAITR
ncbi:putative MFS family arabinose efflux permease [Serratia fonticola]|jgi:predicted MFS family arabinose efflux permease|uniref:Putative MFS family arabinose efflux permease n=1 Tax=Serratia fonticola TaxID=47917 RepID=A0A542D0M1_SERFO|nr:MFS transporter [Serratia fonticola]TQI81360.1 putative MFS family arabinose efflux permease [Serratia fonticola]TQI96616.1 putative MFS family arabinose efflux permease [Serratia fonticola]TVZ71113.1 putative MFS family arabinose efflux permease [Serratia fonticola]